MAKGEVSHCLVDKLGTEIKVYQEGMKLLEGLLGSFLVHRCIFDVLGVCLA